MVVVHDLRVSLNLVCSFAADSSSKCEALGPTTQQHQHRQQELKQNQPSVSSMPASSSDCADGLSLQTDEIRRRILEVKKQKKGTGAWSAASSPYAVAAFFTVVVGVVLGLFLIPEDSRFFNGNSQRERSSESLNSDSYEDSNGQEQYETKEHRQWQRREVRQEQRMPTDDDDESDWKAGQDDDNFYQNSASDADDADDDYAPWSERPAGHAGPAPTRTHRVVQQRMVPPQVGDRLRV